MRLCSIKLYLQKQGFDYGSSSPVPLSYIHHTDFPWGPEAGLISSPTIPTLYSANCTEISQIVQMES